MIPHCTPEQKEHMINLIKEFEGLKARIETKIKIISVKERVKIGTRLTEIVKEMKQFRKDFPYD